MVSAFFFVRERRGERPRDHYIYRERARGRGMEKKRGREGGEKKVLSISQNVE